LSGGGRDPDAVLAGDGVSNLLKFALGLLPHDPVILADYGTTEVAPGGGRLRQIWRIEA